MKIYNITHSDLDGVLCSLSLIRYYGRQNVEIAYCGYNNVNGTLYNLLKSGEHENYDLIYITDISINENMAKWVENNFKDKVVLIDHHINTTTEHLQQYDWVIRQENDKEDGFKTSACKMVYDYLLRKDESEAPVIDEEYDVKDTFFYNAILEEIVDLGREYDTWLWKERDNLKAKELNAICQILGFDRFLRECLSQVAYYDEFYVGAFEFDDTLRLILDLQNEEIERYVESAEKYMYVKEYDGLKIGVYFGERFTSEICNILCENHPESDAVICINMKTGCSIRTVKDDLHVGELAKKIGEAHGIAGNGHSKASGITMTPEFKEKFVDLLLKGTTL